MRTEVFKTLLGNVKRVFFSFKGREYFLSIVAGETNYCNPRKFLANIEEYTEYEIALIDINAGFCYFDDIGLEGWEEQDVQAYIPKEEVEQLIRVIFLLEKIEEHTNSELFKIREARIQNGRT